MDPLNHNFSLTNRGTSNSENTIGLPRHRWYYYKEGFSPELVEKAFEVAHVKKNDFVIDPFNGGGTTTLTASLHGINSLGIEVNPFTAFLSKAKLSTAKGRGLQKAANTIIAAAEVGKASPLNKFSTFSEESGLDKWLFNSSVLNSFEGGWSAISSIKDEGTANLCKMALISSAMQNCNAKRDGKCLRYRETWQDAQYGTDTFLISLLSAFANIHHDIEATAERLVAKRSLIFNDDARKLLSNDNSLPNFKLCVTSPPYLNTFDYSDIYRPELFLGKFIETNKELYNLRLRTVRSHLQAKWDIPVKDNFGSLYKDSIEHLKDNRKLLMHKDIPLMVQAYFEDMENILRLLLAKAAPQAQLWLVVSNSAYAGKEIPVDLILGDIGSQVGWSLKEIGVLRYLNKRTTKHSRNITQLRESVVVFSKQKK